jgi:hypothetical protein
MSASDAHAASLYIYWTVLTPDTSDAENTLARVNRVLESLSLTEHVRIGIAVLDGVRRVELTAITDRGREVLRELNARIKAPPCPEGMCEPTESNGGACQWCGKKISEPSSDA